MITAVQLITSLVDWNDGIYSRVIKLNQAGSVYRILYFAINLWNVLFSSLAVSATAYLATHSDSSDSMFFKIISICNLAFQVLIALVFVCDKVVKPDKKSSQCITAAKRYEELMREIDIQIETYKNLIDDEVISDEYYENLMFYSCREQLVLESEPNFYIKRLMGRRLTLNSIGSIAEKIHHD